MEMKAKVKDDMRASRGARKTALFFAVIVAAVCAVTLPLATRGIPWRALLTSPQFPLLLTAISTLATAIAALATCAQAAYARQTAQHLAAKRASESPNSLQLAIPAAAESPEQIARNGGFPAFLAECLVECVQAEENASALREEMQRTGADAVTASANLRSAKIRNRKLAEYALLSFAEAVLRGLAPPAPPALKP